MILAIDCGNTRAKWGASSLDERDSADHWLARGFAATGELEQLAPQWSAFAPSTIVVANVAGRDAHDRLDAVLRRFDAPVAWITSVASQCGVKNSYEDPSQLGADRWASLIGARRLQPGACLVVTAGTATTSSARRRRRFPRRHHPARARVDEVVAGAAHCRARGA
jgi:type III pantothenate kinase